MNQRIRLDDMTDDQLDALYERLEAAEAKLAAARTARRRVSSALIAVAPLLEQPYPDDPRWTPWTRFVQPALRELRDALLPAQRPSAATGSGAAVAET